MALLKAACAGLSGELMTRRLAAGSFCENAPFTVKTAANASTAANTRMRRFIRAPRRFRETFWSCPSRSLDRQIWKSKGQARANRCCEVLIRCGSFLGRLWMFLGSERNAAIVTIALLAAIPVAAQNSGCARARDPVAQARIPANSRHCL